MTTPKTMKALHLSNPTPTTYPTLTLSDLSIPTPKPGEILLKIHASPIHPSDLNNRLGNFPYITFPRIPGRDFSGLVVSPEFSPLYNKAVYGSSGNTLAFTQDGAQAEYLLVPENGVALKPESLSWVQAATVGVPYTIAALMIKRARVKSGEIVLVLGAGGTVGKAVVQLAGRLGAKVLRGVRVKEGKVRGKEEVDTTGDLGEIDTLAAGKGVNVVFDTVGDAGLTARAINKLAKRGRCVFIAAVREASNLQLDMIGFYRAEKELLGVNSLEYSGEDMAGLLGEMKEGFEKGELKVEESGWTEVKLSDGIEVYERAKKRGAGKFIFLL